MDLYLDIICRTVHLVEDRDGGGEAGYFGGRVEARMFEADENSFNDTANRGCYEQSEFGLREGAMVVSKCQEGAPVAFTFPHFMHADPWSVVTIVAGLDYYAKGNILSLKLAQKFCFVLVYL